MRKIIVIAGPTASGKTSLAVAVAQQIKAPIISADSRQFYRELSIGTAKPTAAEMDNVVHYFVDDQSVENPLTSGEFGRIARQKMEKLFQIHDTIVVVGGSGMFIDALLYEMDPLPHQQAIREKWNTLFHKNGLPFLQEKLEQADPVYYAEVDEQNAIRLIRALEVIEITGETYSSQRKNEKLAPCYPTDFFIIDHDREILYTRINQRVDKMMDDGLLQEVKQNLQFRHLQPLNTVGYKELFLYLDGEISLTAATDLIKRNTRRYAKRQLTWFRKVKNAQWISYASNREMVAQIMNAIT